MLRLAQLLQCGGTVDAGHGPQHLVRAGAAASAAALWQKGARTLGACGRVLRASTTQGTAMVLEACCLACSWSCLGLAVFVAAQCLPWKVWARCPLVEAHKYRGVCTSSLEIACAKLQVLPLISCSLFDLSLIRAEYKSGARISLIFLITYSSSDQHKLQHNSVVKSTIRSDHGTRSIAQVIFTQMIDSGVIG